LLPAGEAGRKKRLWQLENNTRLVLKSQWTKARMNPSDCKEARTLLETFWFCLGAGYLLKHLSQVGVDDHLSSVVTPKQETLSSSVIPEFAYLQGPGLVSSSNWTEWRPGESQQVTKINRGTLVCSLKVPRLVLTIWRSPCKTEAGIGESCWGS
jgi:hypothetical protein